MNQLEQAHEVVMTKQGDFMIDDKYLFEVGGSNKSYDQIADLPESYLSVDNTA